MKKENAVLKQRNIKDCKDFNRAIEKIGEHLNQKQNQLTEAIEIIKELLDTQSKLDPYRDIFKDRILKAEQFLSGVEK